MFVCLVKQKVFLVKFFFVKTFFGRKSLCVTKVLWFKKIAWQNFFALKIIVLVQKFFFN